ncbi:MAG TPA: class I SAM-dependent methyltransferase [Ktedonobacterales bacterium]|jgi:SAM-dependent methyltransferase|nr:class I SAM-dependent methyltransferase [Ktedonobacterales bacterium]
MAVQRNSQRAHVLRALFGVLYRNRTLYWIASTIPFAGQWRRWQRLVLPRLKGTHVLEVGCGLGTLLADMVQEGYRCSAVDQSPQMVAAARDRLRRRGLPPENTPIQQASVLHLPFVDASFDSVVSTFPTEYIADPRVLGEIGRVLRPGGRLIIVLGAGLLPTRLALWPLVFIQRLVYGAGAAGSGSCTGEQPIRVNVPLEAGGLTGRAECVRGPFWVAYLVVAEKPD